jgi:fructokinase
MSVICLGELLIDFVALQTGVSVGEADSFKKAPGGAPANVAAAVAKLGMDAGFLGQVGDDPFGYFLAEVLREVGVDVSGLRFTPKARTALAFVSLRDDGERSFAFYRHPSADMLLTTGELDLSLIDRYKFFHFGSITLIDDPVRGATLEAIEYARDRGLRISYDPNLRLALWNSADDARAGMWLGFRYANFVKISEEEVSFMTGKPADEGVADLWTDATELIMVTRGANGATAFTREGETHVPGHSVQAVDTTGAGDAFVAGMLYGILKHGEAYPTTLPEIINFANAVGALTTTERGAIPALPTLGQALALASSAG